MDNLETHVPEFQSSKVPKLKNYLYIDNLGTLKPWNLGTLEPWNLGTLKPWNLGTLEHWNLGTFKPDVNYLILQCAR